MVSQRRSPEASLAGEAGHTALFKCHHLASRWVRAAFVCGADPGLAVPWGIMPGFFSTRLLPDFDLLSVSDARLNEQLKPAQADELKLVAPYSHEELRFGPIKVKKRVAAPTVDRRALEFAWLAKLKQAIA